MPPSSLEFRDWSKLSEPIAWRRPPSLRPVPFLSLHLRRHLSPAVALSPRLRPPAHPASPPPVQAYSKSSRLHAFSRLVIPKPITAALTTFPSTLLSSSRGHLILLVRPCGLLQLVDALTSAERVALQLPSPHFPYHAALTPITTSSSFPSTCLSPSPSQPQTPPPDWTNHCLPCATSFVTTVIEFRGRVLGVTDRAQLLEFRLDANTPYQAVQMLPSTGLPDNAMFERWHFGACLVAARERLLLLLLMTDLDGGDAMTMQTRVQKLSVRTFDMATMRWEEVDNTGDHNLFVDYVGRCVVACTDATGCAAEANQVYFVQPQWRMTASGWTILYWKASPGGEGEKLFISEH